MPRPAADPRTRLQEDTVADPADRRRMGRSGQHMRDIGPEPRNRGTALQAPHEGTRRDYDGRQDESQAGRVEAMSDPFTSLGAVPLAGFVVLTIGTLLLVRREPRTSPLAYLLLASGVGLGTFVAWGQVQAAIDRQWAIDRADQAECFVPRQTGTLPRLLTTEAGAHAALSAGRTEQAAHLES
jgi:hypothetical protein